MLQMLQKIKVEKQMAPYLFKIYNYIFKMLSQKGVIHIQEDPRQTFVFFFILSKRFGLLFVVSYKDRETLRI